MRIAPHHAAGDVRTGHGTDLRGHEHGANLGGADDFFAALRRQHAGHGRLQLIDGVVDDAVVTDVDVVALGQLARADVGPYVEANDHRLGGNRQVDVGFADAANARVHQLHLDLVVGELEQRLPQRLLRALHVGLDDDGQVLDLARRHVGEHVLQLGGLLLGQLGVAELAGAVGGDFARPALVGHHHEVVAGLRHFGQALDLDGNRRASRLGRLAVFVQHGAHAAAGLAGQHHIADLQRAGLHQHGGDRAAALVQAGFDHDALGGGFDRRLQFQHLGL